MRSTGIGIGAGYPGGGYSPFLSDFSGNNYTGTMMNMGPANVVSANSLYSKYCVCLKRSAENYVTIGNVLAYERNQAFSISFWMKYFGSAGYIVAKTDPWNTYRGYGVDVDVSGGITFALFGNYGTNSFMYATSVASSVVDGLWHHVVATYNGDSNPNNMQFYVDGGLIGKTVNPGVLSSTIVSNAALSIGAAPNSPGNGYGGAMDDVAIYGKALTLAEAQWIYNAGAPRSLLDVGCPPNLDGWWRMGDGDTYPTIVDMVSTHNGTMTTMNTGDISPNGPQTKGLPGGYSKRYMYLAGGAQLVTMGNVLDLAVSSDPRIISFWFRTSTADNDRTILAKRSVGNGYWVQILSTGELRLGFNGTTAYFKTTAKWNDGLWHHCSFQYNLVYIDGVSRQFSATLGSIATNNAVAFTIGNYSGGNANTAFIGSIDDVAIYSKNLSVAEMQWLYNNGVPRDLTAGGAPSNLAAWWKMGD